MKDFIIFSSLILAMFACGYILQQPIVKGLALSEKRATSCILVAFIIAVFIGPWTLPELMAGWLSVCGIIAFMVGIFGPTVLKVIQYGLKGAYGIRKSDDK